MQILKVALMPQDFSGQNLRGRSFKGQNLEGADFSCADAAANFCEKNHIDSSNDVSVLKSEIQGRRLPGA
jgi:uncharacterized protein YjbI with pentapeptide repeats